MEGMYICIYNGTSGIEPSIFGNPLPRLPFRMSDEVSLGPSQRAGMKTCVFQALFILPQEIG